MEVKLIEHMQARSAFERLFTIQVSVRAGEAPDRSTFHYFLDKLFTQATQDIKLGDRKDRERVQLLFHNMATLSMTVGEIKELAGKTENQRESRLTKLVEDWEKGATASSTDVSGSASIMGIGGSGAFKQADAEQQERLTKEYVAELNKSLNEIQSHLAGVFLSLRGLATDKTGSTKRSQISPRKL